MIQEQWSYIVWCLMALLLVGGGLVRAERRRAAGAHGPGMLASAAIWLGAILLIVLMYEGLSFWTAVGALFG
jgi:hypothetical protein